MRSHASGALQLAILSIALAACGTHTGDPGGRVVVGPLPPAAEVQFFGPWSAIPFGVPPALLPDLDLACRTSMQPFPAAARVVVVDARGAGVVQMSYAGADGSIATCNDLRVDRAGKVVPEGGGSTSFGPAPPPLQAFGLDLTEHSSHGSPRHPPVIATYLGGRVGPGIAVVHLAQPGRPPVRATIGAGWWILWIPGDLAPGWFLRGLDASGTVVANLTEGLG